MFSNAKLNDELLKLFEQLVFVMKKKKNMAEDQISSKLIFELYNMTENNRSKILNESASYINPEFVNKLLEDGLIQKITILNEEKYSLTFNGISKCISIKYNKTLEEQFKSFLILSDKKFNAGCQSDFSWKEKVATLSLVLIGSTSEPSAVRVDVDENKCLITELFQKVLDCLKKYELVEKELTLKTIGRNENPGCMLMSRLNDLPRKTNHYYKVVGKGSAYYFDIEIENNIDKNKLFFLLKKIFNPNKLGYDYKKIYDDLINISQQYYPQFYLRKIKSSNLLEIYEMLKDFLEFKIHCS